MEVEFKPQPDSSIQQLLSLGWWGPLSRAGGAPCPDLLGGQNPEVLERRVSWKDFR